MKRIIFLLTIFWINLWCSASTITERADSAYNAENFNLALELYHKAVKEDGVSSTLYYNLGNAQYRTGDMAGAIVSYNRALRINPNNEDAKVNLEFLNSKIIDKQPDERSLTQKIADNVVYFFRADHWAVITLICFIAMLCTIAGYLFLTGVGMRKFSFFATILFLILTVLSGIVSYKAAKLIDERRFAIITVPSVQLSTTPRAPLNKNEEAALLHSGSKVKIVDSLRVATDTVSPKWYEVEFRQGQRAWVNAENLEVI